MAENHHGSGKEHGGEYLVRMYPLMIMNGFTFAR